MVIKSDQKALKQKVPIKHTGHIRIGRHGASEVGERFVKLVINGGDGKRTTLERIDNLENNKSLGARLNRLGAHLITDAAARELLNRIQGKGPQPASFTVATKLGWHGGQFVFPDQVIAGEEGAIEVYPGAFREGLATKYHCAGSRKGWAEIPRLASGNTRFMLALALAFVGPIGDVLQVEQVGVQLVGDPGSGKTAIILIGAGSVWGLNPDRGIASNRGFGETWNNTANHLEQVALAHNHTLLALDETRASDKKTTLTDTVLSVIMRLEKAAEKGRLTDTTPPRSWWVPLLSTSNKSLDEMAAADRVAVDDAHRGRLIDVPNPGLGHGVFETLHDCANHAELSKRLIALSLAHYGHASRVFVKKLVAWRQRDEAGLRAWLEKRRNYYLERASKLESSGRDLLRIHGKFATIYAAGCLAQKFGLLPWNWRELRDALLACEEAHVAQVQGHLAGQGHGSARPSPLEQLQAYIRANESKFVDLTKEDASSGEANPNPPGYHSEHRGQREYLFPHAVIERVAGGKAGAQALKAELAARQLIATAGGGKGGDRYVVKRPIRTADGQSRRVNVIAIPAAVLSPG